MKRAITQIFTLLLLITLAAPAFAGKVLAEIEYFYSDDGTLVGKAFNGKRVNFEYDLRGQLLAVKNAQGKDLERYTYDPAGNRLSKTINGLTTTYTYDKANQLVTSTVNGVTTHYKYDAAGRMIQAGDKSYIYNGQNKVTEVRQNGKTIAKFEYNIDGQIAKAIYGDKVEEFMWDGLALIWRSGVTYINEPYVTGGNPVMAGDDVLFNDMLGSTLAVNGKSVEMTSFGETGAKNAFFTGKPMIDELGYSFLFRDYNPNQGKWTTTDPLGYPDGWNNLAYVNNGVTNTFDWLGAWKLHYESGETSITEVIDSGITPNVVSDGLSTVITEYKLLVSFNVGVNSKDYVSSLTVNSKISAVMMSKTTVYSLGSTSSSDWKEDSRYACSLAYSTTYSIDNYGAISVGKDGDSTRQEFTTATGGLLDKTSVALAQIVPSQFPDGNGQNFNHQVGGRGAYAATNILNSISVGWGAASFSFNFNNISKETKFMSTTINIKKINE